MSTDQNGRQIVATLDDLENLAAEIAGGGGGGTQTVYVQPTDPGAVGAGKLWVDTTSDPPFILRRGVGDDEWVDLLSAYVAAAGETIDLTGGGGAAGDAGGSVLLTGGTGDDGATEGASIVAFGGTDTDPGFLRGKTDGSSGGAGQVLGNTEAGHLGWLTLEDISSALPEVPATPDAQDIVDALIALGLVTQAAP